MLTDSQIEILSKKMSFPLEGCYFKDELPRNLNYNKVYIINMQNSINDDGQDNEGTHWTFLQVNKYPNGKIEPFYFDPYGQPPPEEVKKFVKKNCAQELPYNEKDIQSLMNNACGFYCCALAHFINKSQYRTSDLYEDADKFLDMFNDLNKTHDFKHNEFVLKHFFRNSDPTLRKEIDINSIISQDSKQNPDMVKIPIDVK